jgi:death-on-curing protein
VTLPSSIYFLSVDEVKVIHADQISRYGGAFGIRDEGLLSSAVAQPCGQFADQYLHKSLPEMAAAYLFHLVMNHPFVDGNKRVGVASARGSPRQLGGW